MALGKQALKSRIRSVRATRKITSAMELMANAKLQRQRGRMEKNREYVAALRQITGRILADQPESDCVYLQPGRSSRTLSFLFLSDMGLCGGYNSSLIRLAEETLNPQDPLIVIGTRGSRSLQDRGLTSMREPISSDQLSAAECSKLADQALTMFVQGQIGTIQALFCSYVNAVTFQPQCQTLLPLAISAENETAMKVQTLFEPGPDEILNELIPMAVHSQLYSVYLQTKTAEQGWRRMAMESATDNADELAGQLTLQYNQARQAAITQEITEIVAGADAS